MGRHSTNEESSACWRAHLLEVVEASLGSCACAGSFVMPRWLILSQSPRITAQAGHLDGIKELTSRAGAVRKHGR